MSYTFNIKTSSSNIRSYKHLYSFSPIEQTGWVAVVEQPKNLAYKPVHDLLGRMTVLTARPFLPTV